MNVIPFEYQGQAVRFSIDGWINATDIAKRYGREPKAWLRQVETVEYLIALADALGYKSDALTQLNKIKELDTSKAASRTKTLKLAKETGLVKVSAGAAGGTWLHPKLAVAFARWLDVRFGVWCDMQIDAIMRSDVSAMEKYAEATKALAGRKELASAQGKGLAAWRWEKEPLQRRAEYWRDQLQMALPLH